MTSRWHHFLDHQAETRPDAPAMADSIGNTWTYGALSAAADALRDRLTASGVRPGDRVMLIAENCADYAIHVFAIWHCDAWAMPVNARMSDGEIDRLIEHDDRLIAVDFKTNAAIPDDPSQCPEGLLRQMGAYCGLLSQVYPRRRIDTAILWTAAPKLMLLPHDLVTKALWQSCDLDAGHVHS